MVGPTNVQPRFFRSFDSAIDCGVVLIFMSCARVRRFGRASAGGSHDQKYAASEPVLVDQLERALGVVDRRFDLAAMPDDAGVLQQALHVARAEARDHGRLEILEGRRKLSRLRRIVIQLRPD